MISALAAPRSRPRSRVLSQAVLIVVAAGAGLLLFAVSCSGSRAVDRVTIVNRTPFDVEVKLSDAEKESWLILGHASRESTTIDRTVTDMGQTWVFRFHYGGRDVGELTIDRDELMRARWRVEVPSTVAERMRRLGFDPPPDT